MILGIQEATVMEGCNNDIISPLESPETCDDEGVLEHQELMVHQTSPGFIWLSGRPTYVYKQSEDRPTHYISRSICHYSHRLDNRIMVEDIRVVYRPTQ
jgi:hypothetical protein